MYAIGHFLKEIREERGLPLQYVQAESGISVSLLSGIENGRRLPTVEQVTALASVYDFDERRLITQRESDRTAEAKKYPETEDGTFQAAESKAEYGVQQTSLFQNAALDLPIALESRRYIGNKAKLADWIMDIIETETGGCSGTFCDLFAGSGSVSKRALSKYDKVIINDFLFSNNIIYKAFFGPGKWDRGKLCDLTDHYNAVEPCFLTDNYFSVNFGGKFFEYELAKLIGYIREDLEAMRNELTDKEYCIMLATLIYNIDRHANTVGHFDAYIKKPITPRPFRMRLIDADTCFNAEIHRTDSNILARSIKADITYLDPPYNSRQYCRFYHLYENLVKWEKPRLYGVALKPTPENMSAYCTAKATSSFEDLLRNIESRYIAVSYNNTYNSKSHSSENKIQLNDIERILNMCGDTKVFEHEYSAFNTGRTEFKDHKELLFVTKVDNEKKRESFSSFLCRG